MNSRMLMLRCTSPSASFSALPSSRVSVRASSSFFASMMRTARNRILPRSGAGVSRHAGKAALAAPMASRISSRGESGTMATTSSVWAGLRRSKNLVARDSTHFPPIKFLHAVVLAVAVAMAFSLIANFAQRFVEQPNAFVHVGFGNVHRRRHANHIVVEPAFADEQPIVARAFEELARRFRCRFLCFAIFHQFNALHHPHAANVANQFMLLLQLLEPLAKISADHISILAKIVFLDDFNHRARRH